MLFESKRLQQLSGILTEDYHAEADDILVDDKETDVEKLGEDKKLKNVEVTYSNGDVIITNMASHLTDEQIKDYYKIGRSFNIGKGEVDNVQSVKSVRILEEIDPVEEAIARAQAQYHIENVWSSGAVFNKPAHRGGVALGFKGPGFK